MDDTEFEEGQTQVPHGATLFVFSDGIYEITKQSGDEVELSEFVEILRKPEQAPGQKVNEVLETMRDLQGRSHFDDDVSLMEFRL
jgi:sigma-B regulation protein RsbU (phosphoserine phosphatase)